MLKEEDLERVSGIARYHERMWIQRDEEGKIKQVYDLNLNPIDKTLLHRSFESTTCEDGFIYKGEFIPMDDSRDIARKRSQGYQRHNKGHDTENVLQS
ncbi:MAG: hypothetical protein PQJ58_01585 [Spirochaetales bacterium]|nr:hypothetical protein [Spirochaetales bacterium]